MTWKERKYSNELKNEELEKIIITKIPVFGALSGFISLSKVKYCENLEVLLICSFTQILCINTWRWLTCVSWLPDLSQRILLQTYSVSVNSRDHLLFFSSQIRLQGDAPQFYLLFGAPGQTAGLLSLPGGAAGKKGKLTHTNTHTYTHHSGIALCLLEVPGFV